jgi:predicted ATPase
MTSLRVALNQLRQGAPEALEAGDVRVKATVQADAATLLRTLENGELAEAADLYKGPFLEGFYLSDWGAELEEWVYSTREFLAERVREALLRLAEGEAAAGEFKTAAKRAEGAYTLPGAPEPGPEELRRLYRLLVAGGSLRASDLQKEAKGYDIRLNIGRDEAKARLYTSQKMGERALPTPNNLPVRNTSFVGRDPELIELAKLLLSETKLITLTGIGGVGKTRLAVQAAYEQLKTGVRSQASGEPPLAPPVRGGAEGGGVSFPDGIYFVALDALSEVSLIPSTIAAALEIKLPGRDEALKELIRSLKDKRLLLILDNYEHLVSGATVASELVTHCPQLTLLITSRERLNLEGEQVFLLEGLPFFSHAITLEDARYQDSVKLFLQRAKRARLDFVLTPENLPHILDVCRLLQGSPLGIELAAAWVRMLSPADIAKEIAQNLDFLTAGARNVHERHHSLRATFEHSWKLLTPKEQEVLRKLSVFVGGFTREAASQVAGSSIPLLASLVDKSLLRVLPSSRYDRHPLLYGYTQEKLAKHPEEQVETRARHAAYFLALAEEAEPQLRGAEQALWLERLEVEHDNLRSALRHAKESDKLRSVGALWWFWYVRGHLSEGRAWLTKVLSAPELAEPTSERAVALSGAGVLASFQGDYVSAQAFHEESLAIRRKLNSSQGIADSLHNLAIVVRMRGDYAKARALTEESLAIRRALGNKSVIAASLNNLGNIAALQGDYAAARTLYAECLALRQALGDERGVALLLNNLGLVTEQQGDNAAARVLFEKSLTSFRKLGSKQSLLEPLNNLGRIVRKQGDYALAPPLFYESLTIGQEIDAKPDMAEALKEVAGLAAAQGEFKRAARLWGVAEALREAIGAPLPPDERPDYEREVAHVRAQLDEAAFKAAWQEGRVMTLEEAVAFALASPDITPAVDDLTRSG